MIFLFPAGAAVLAIACVISLDPAGASAVQPVLRAVLWLIFVLFMALEVYTLFFAFPVRDGYARAGEKRRVCVTGVYALCRHPGVLWLTFAFVCLSLCAGLPWLHTAIYAALDVALVLFEDRYVFPRLMAGYDDYQRSTPFLVPTPHSIRSFMNNGKTTD